MKIFEKLKKHADSNKLSHTDIGNRSGKSQQTISNYFSGKNQMPLDWLIWYLEQYPEIDVAELFDQQSPEYVVSESRHNYNGKMISKKSIINKISKILDEEL